MVRKHKKEHKKIPANYFNNLTKVSPYLPYYVSSKTPSNTIYNFINNNRKSVTAKQNKHNRNHEVFIGIQPRLNTYSHCN